MCFLPVGDRGPDSGVWSGPVSAAHRATPTSFVRHAPGENALTATAHLAENNSRFGWISPSDAILQWNSIKMIHFMYNSTASCISRKEYI